MDRTQTARIKRQMADRRALAFPDEPYSAYCKLCWNAVYTFWADKSDHHGGVCEFGHATVADCPEAAGRERNKARLAKLMEVEDDPT
jgi:hypothetical protein